MTDNNFYSDKKRRAISASAHPTPNFGYKFLFMALALNGIKDIEEEKKCATKILKLCVVMCATRPTKPRIYEEELIISV